MELRCHHEIVENASNSASLDIVHVGSSSTAARLTQTGAEASGESVSRAAPGLVPLTDTLAAFRAFAADAIASGDPAELHNAAMEAARKWKLTSPIIRRVLATIGRERPEFRNAAAEWRDEDTGCPVSFQTSLSDEELNQLLARHAIETDWDNASVARELYRVQFLATQVLFGNRLPLAVLSFKHTANGSRSSLRIERNGLGVKYEINLNLANIGKSRVNRAAHVIHELVHLHEALFECRDPTGNYHSKRFLVRAAELGIPTTPSGMSLGVTAYSPVERLLQYMGIPLQEAVAGDGDVDSVGGRPKRSMRKIKLVPWNCGCTEIYAPAGTAIEGQCLKASCGGLWKPTVLAVPAATAGAEHEGSPSAESGTEDQLTVLA
jgi:hypothetical protein